MIVAGDLRSAVTAIRTEPTASFTVGGGVGPGGTPPPKPTDPAPTLPKPTDPAPTPTPTPSTSAPWTTGPVTGVTTTVDLTPDDPGAPTGPIDEHVLGDINEFSAAFRRVGKMEWILDPGEAERLKADGASPELIATPGFGRGHWVYHGHGTIARQQAMFVAAKTDPLYRKMLTVHEASFARGSGWSPTEGRIYERLLTLVASSADPGDAPLGNDGLPINYGSGTGYGNGGVPATTPGGQPLGPGGAVTAPTPGPEGHGGSVTSGKPPVLKKLPEEPTNTSTRTIAIVALAAGVAYLLLACNNGVYMQAHVNVEKRSVYFPFKSPITGLMTGISVPGTNMLTSGVGLFAGNGFASLSPDTGVLPLTSVAQKIQLPAHSPGELMGISIAPDSMYSRADIWTRIDGVVESFRIDTQHPGIGIPLTEADVFVTVPQMIPWMIPNATSAYWDGMRITDTVNSTIVAWPLRLLFWYGMAPTPISNGVRAPLSARIRTRATAALQTNLFVPIEGRRIVNVRVIAGTGTFAITTWHGQQDSAAPNIESNLQRPIGTAGFVSVAPESPAGSSIAESNGSIVLNAPTLLGAPLLQVSHTAPGGGGDPAALTVEVYAADN